MTPIRWHKTIEDAQGRMPKPLFRSPSASGDWWFVHVFEDLKIPVSQPRRVMMVHSFIDFPLATRTMRFHEDRVCAWLQGVDI